MANNNEKASNLVPALSAEDSASLIAFKRHMNESLKSIFPDKNFGLSEDANPYSSSFNYTIDSFILNKDLYTAYPELEELAKAYEKLPESIKAPKIAKNTFFDPPSGNMSTAKQAQEVINLAQNYLDIEETNDGSIDEKTSRAIRKKLHELQDNNPDIEINFSPEKYDARTVKFLDALNKKHMAEAGVNSGNLNQTLIQIWVLEQNGQSVNDPTLKNLGESSALLNVMSLINSGTLPNGANTQRPETSAPWDKNWKNDDAPDRFFSPETYASLADGYDVSAKILFAENPSNPNAKLLKELAEELWPYENKAIYTEADIGRLAIEMLSRQAKELCIEEKDVNEAIHDGRFMPHLYDLQLVEAGFGFPEKLWDEVEAKKNQINQYGVNKEAEIQYSSARDDVSKFRNHAFAERFGEMPQSAIDKRAEILSGYGMSGERLYQRIKDNFSSPGSYFLPRRAVTGSTSATPYEIKREAEYLPKRAALIADGELDDCNKCRPDADLKTESDKKPSHVFNNSAQSEKMPDDTIRANAQDITGNNSDDINITDRPSLADNKPDISAQMIF